MFLGRLAEPQSCSFPLKVKIGRNPALLLESIRVRCLGASSSASRLTYFPSPSTKAQRGAEQLGHLRISLSAPSLQSPRHVPHAQLWLLLSPRCHPLAQAQVGTFALELRGVLRATSLPLSL